MSLNQFEIETFEEYSSLDQATKDRVVWQLLSELKLGLLVNENKQKIVGVSLVDKSVECGIGR